MSLLYYSFREITLIKIQEITYDQTFSSIQSRPMPSLVPDIFIQKPTLYCKVTFNS